MVRIRSVQDAYQMLKAEDPDTPVSVSMIRRLLADGTIPCIRNGRKIYLNYDILLDYLSQSCTDTEDNQQEVPDTGGIRPVDVKLR